MAGKGTLTVKVLGDTKPFEKSVGGIGGKIGKFAAVGAAAFAGVAAAAVAGAFKVASFGDEVAKTSQKAGLGVEQMQELRFAFGQGGVDAAKMDTALQKFNKNLGEAATTGGPAAEAFESLGVKLRDSGGNIRDTGVVLDEVLPKLAAIESDAERAAVAGDLLGMRAGPELAAALADGVEGIDAARAKAQELGIVMGEDAAKAAEKFTDQWDDIKQSSMGLVRQGLIPVMEVLSAKIFPAIQAGIGTLQELWGEFQSGATATEGLRNVFDRLWGGEHGGIFAGILDAARSAISGVIDWFANGGFTQIFQFIIDARERLLNAAMQLFPALVDAAVEFLPQLLSWITDTMIPQLLEFVVGAVPMLLKAGVTLFESLVDAVVNVLPVLVGTLLGEVLPSVLKTVLGMIPQLLKTAVSLFLMLVDAVMEVLPDLIRVLLGEVLPNLLDTVLGMLPQLLQAAVTTFLALVQAVLKVLPDLISILLTEVLPTLLTTIVGMIPQLLDAAIELFTSLIDALPVIIPQLVGIIFTDLIPAVIDAVMQLVPKLFEAGKEIIKGLIRGIGSMVGAVGRAIGDIAGKIRDALPFSPAKEGPLSGSGSPDRAGAKIGEMLAGGLTSTTPELKRAAARAAEALRVGHGGWDGAAAPTALPANRRQAALSGNGQAGSSQITIQNVNLPHYLGTEEEVGRAIDAGLQTAQRRAELLAQVG